MTYVKKRTTAVLGVGLLVAAVGAYIRHYDVIHITPLSFAATQDLVLPHIQVLLPDADTPRPAVLMFHGCGGVKPSLYARAEELAARGYVAVVVDSFRGRGIEWQRVCDGLELFGDQRAADVLVALEYARHHPAIRANQLFLAGYSHGGWTVLEALAYNGELPRGLQDSPADPLAGVRGVVAWYPYCGIATHFRRGWQSRIPVLMLLAGEDDVTDPEPCAVLAQAQVAAGLPVTWKIFAGAGHGFDTTEDWVVGYDPQIHDEARTLQFDFLDQHSG